jgi:alanine racemase
MSDIPNGFTGFSNRRHDFESAGDAMRKSAAKFGEGELSASFTSPYQKKQTSSKLPTYVPSLADTLAKSNTKTRDDFDIRRFVRMPESVTLADMVEGSHTKATFSAQALEDIPEQARRHAWVEVDLGAIHHNVLAARSLVNPGTKLLAVVKADAYGHGAVAVARTAINSGADYLGVATVDEGVELRKAGITAPIMILAQPPLTAIPLLLAHNILPSIYDPHFAIAYAEAADAIGASAPFHLKINSGMNRIGVRTEDVAEFLQLVSFHRALEIAGTFTHFACADEYDTMQTRLQLEHFEDAIRTMRSLGVNPGIVHCANTAATMRFPQAHFNMVRFGIGLYGIHPSSVTSDIVQLKPAMSIHARVTQVKSVPVGEGVSYGLRYKSAGYARVCTIPVGYADGLRRGLSGRMDVLMGGRRHKQIGNICMDQCMFEVDMRTRAGMQKLDPMPGDEVVLLGSQGGEQILIEEMADMLGTIPYEVCIGFGSLRLPRIYK